MVIKLPENNYGSSGIHLLRVAKQQGRHDIRDLALSIRFEGDFEAAHIKGDNRNILPADTMKNTVYALSRQHSIEALENFGLHLIEHFLTYNPQVTRVLIEASDSIWTPLPHARNPPASAFPPAGTETPPPPLTGTPQRPQVRTSAHNL